MTENLTIDHLINKKKIANALFYHLSNEDLNQCALVNKSWHTATKRCRELKLTVELLDRLDSKDEKLQDYIDRNYRNAVKVDIYGWSRGTHIPNDVYDNLLTPHFRPKTLILRGRGCWDTCRCPDEGSLSGEQIDSSKEDQLTDLECIHVGTTFCISACALLDLVARSPKLRVLKFYGRICKNDHYDLFNRKRFHCDLERLYWPWPDKKHTATMTTLVKRNENLTTFFSNADITSDLLAAESLPNIRFLSLTLNENWYCKPNKLKRVDRFLQKIRYLSTATKLEALEVRTFEVGQFCEDCADTNTKAERIFENYKLAFWQQVSKLHNLKFLAIYGAWEFESVCREMAKHHLQIEYLKINLTPSSVLSAIDAEEDCPILSMVDGIRNLKKLSKLKSLHYICYERLGSIDTQTTTALKEIVDILWILDIKTGYTEEVEDLMKYMMRRGNQLQKTFRYFLHIQAKLGCDKADILTERILKYPMSTVLKDKIVAIAEYETAQRYRKTVYENFHIWGMERIANNDKTYEPLATSWKLYNDYFNTNLELPP